MPTDYSAIVSHLRAAIAELDKLGLGQSLAKGRVGEILLAHELGHTLVPGDKGCDGRDDSGCLYEYKVSTDNQFNFNFGHARGKGEIDALVDRHFDGYTGAYCGLLEDGEVTTIVYCPATSLVPPLKAHLATVTGSTFQKVFSPIDKFASLNGAIVVKGTISGGSV